jgi:hypothetical protein
MHEFEQTETLTVSTVSVSSCVEVCLDQDA